MTTVNSKISTIYTVLNPRIKVILGATYWTLNGVNIFSINLARGLRSRGFDARILLTEEYTTLVTVNDAAMERPVDIPFEVLPVEPGHTWGAHWGATIAYLENHAPCIYIPNSDWRHSSVSPLLSDRVFVVGIVHSDDPLHYDHVARLGRYWNAIVTTSNHIAAKTLLLDATLRESIFTIPIGVHIPSLETLRDDRSLQRPLKVIYHGVLKQQQKRILDLPQIVALAVERHIKITLTIAGGGPDEALLRASCAELVAMGIITFLGVVPHDRLLPLLEEHDAYLLTSEFEGMPNALLEAMGRGCIPVVSDIVSAIPELIRQGENGYILPVGDIEGFVNRLACLQHSPELRQMMARQAYASVSSGPYGVDDMVRSYLELFAKVTSDSAPCNFHRGSGELNHPPTEIAGIGILPLRYLFREEGLGCFPSRFVDCYEFMNELKKIQRPAGTLLQKVVSPEYVSMSGVTVIISATTWTRCGVNDFSLALARGLSAEKMTVRILLTEEDSHLVTDSAPRMPLPEDITFVRLPVDRNAGWGGRWGGIIRYLEDNAPCIYIPNHDWRHSCVTPLLSQRIAVVGVVHRDDPFHRDHVRRLGTYWDAIVTFSDIVASEIFDFDHTLGARLAVIPPDTDRWVLKYIQLFQQIFDNRLHCSSMRPEGLLTQPPTDIAGNDILPLHYLFQKEGIGPFPNRFIDYSEFQQQLRLIRKPEETLLGSLIEPPPLPLDGVTVIIGATSWVDCGVNDFSLALARAFGNGKRAARILLTEEKSDQVKDLAPRRPRPDDVTFVTLPVDRSASWGGRWGAMIRYLEENAPCVYIPNHDWRHSCVTPLLSNRVAVVGVMHGDDPFHEDHLRRLGSYWDAVVTFSDTLAARLSHADPTLGPRIAVISTEGDGLAVCWSRMLEQLFDAHRCCIHQRPDGMLNLPPAHIDGIGIFPVPCPHIDEEIGALPSCDADQDEFYEQVSLISTEIHPRIKHFIAKITGAGKVHDVMVFQWYDYLIFSLLTCFYLAALSSFFMSWFSKNGWSNHPLLYGVISLMIIVTTINKLGRWFLLPLMKRPLPMEPHAGMKCAVITTFVGSAESVEMLTETVRAMIAMDYPHDTWILDEDDVDQVKELCVSLGAKHFSRKNMPEFQQESGLFKSHCKHGNVNAWLHAVGFTVYDYLASFDPDHIPEKSFLDRTLGYFIDPDVGYVQAPQQYYNQSSSIVARGAAEETYDYFSCIQMAAYGMGYPIILGAHNSHRMKALQQVGGFAPHDADDLMLTALYRNAGWKGVYVPELLAYGLTPVDWTSYLRQQRRWARSVIDLKLWHYPRISRNLSLRSQSMSFLHGLNYFHKSFIIALALALLLCMLACGTPPEAFPAIVVTKFAFVLLLLQVLELWRQKFYLDKTTERGIHWRAGLMHMAKWPVMLLALYDALTRRRFSYETTSKVRSSRGRSGIIRQSFLIIFLTMAASLAGAGSAGPVSPLLYLTAFCVIVGSALLIVTELNGFPEPFQKKMHLKKDNS